METADYTVRYDNVTIKRGDYTVLSGVNIKVTQGEMVYLTGVVGSGKSSLLKTMYGELKCAGNEAIGHVTHPHTPITCT